MGIFNFFKKKGNADLSKLEDHFILHVGECYCADCKKQTMNCVSIMVGEQSVCVCPKKDVKGFRKPKNL